MVIIDWDLVLRIAMPLVALIVGVALNKAVEDRPGLVTYYGHTSAHVLKDPAGQRPDIQIHTHSVVVRNSGRKTATNVRVGHIFLPDFNVFPPVKHDVEYFASGAADIVFPTLVPKEQVTIGYVYFPPVIFNQINTNVKSDEAIARVLDVLPTPQPARWLVRVAWMLAFVGFVTVLYLCYVAGMAFASTAG